MAELEAERDSLRAQELEIGTKLDTANLTTPDETVLAEVRSQLLLAIRTGPPATLKGLLKALVVRLTVQARSAIEPVFRVPAGAGASPQVYGARIQHSNVGVTQLNPNTLPTVNGPVIRLSEPSGAGLRFQGTGHARQR